MATADWLLEKFKIEFDDRDPKNSHRETGSHETLFKHVRAIEDVSFEGYDCSKQNIFIETLGRPWRSNMQKRATLLADTAKKCLADNDNETGWRMKLENAVLGRFDFEINCAVCRMEGWYAVEDPTVAEKFRSPRKRCQCNPSEKKDPFEDGLSPLFGCNLDTPVKHHKSIVANVKDNREPDRVYGLRKTPRLRRLLEETSARGGALIGDRVTASPYSGKNKRLLWPYLILEAKSERSKDNFSNAREQSAGVIVTCLEMQAELAAAVRDVHPENSSLKHEPLVWFLSNKGEEWHVATGFFRQPTKEKPAKYRVETLWKGFINDREHALRILLVVDYIYDWARDVYRKNILDQLLALAENTTTTLAADTDLLTIAENQHPDFPVNFGGDDFVADASNAAHLTPSDLLEIFDSDDPIPLALRDAKHMVHEFRGIDLTAENFEDYVQSSSNDVSKDPDVAYEIQKALRGLPWLITLETLDAIELLWTGRDREHGGSRSYDEKVLVKFAISSHICPPPLLNKAQKSNNSTWQQIHRLSFVAITEEVVEVLHQRANSEIQFSADLGFDMTKEDALAFFKSIRHASVRECLSAALSSLQKQTFVKIDLHAPFGFSGPHLTPPREPCLVNILRGNTTLRATQKMYQKLQLGRRDLNESFFRYSRLVHEQIDDPKDINDWSIVTRPVTSSEHAVLAYVEQRNKVDIRHKHKSYCVFIVDSARVGSGSSPDSVRDHELATTDATSPIGTDIQDLCPVFRIRTDSDTDRSTAVLPISPQDLTIFLDRVEVQWSALQTLNQKSQKGSNLPRNQLTEKIEARHATTKDVWGELTSVGCSYGLQQIIQYVRNLKFAAECPSVGKRVRTEVGPDQPWFCRKRRLREPNNKSMGLASTEEGAKWTATTIGMLS